MQESTIGYQVFSELKTLLPPIISIGSLLLSITMLSFSSAKAIRVANASHWSGFKPTLLYWAFSLGLLWLFALIGQSNPFIEHLFQAADHQTQRYLIWGAASAYGIPLTIAIARVLTSYWKEIMHGNF